MPKIKQDYLIGIDLGTTNCTVAYAELNQEQPSIQQFPIPQIVAAGTEGESFSLPSFVYFPLSEEHKKNATAASRNTGSKIEVGSWARDRGAEVPNRVIASAKSWLCHAGIDRRGKLLPLEYEEEKMSPLEACSSFLGHVKEAWDNKNPQAAFQAQQIYITVPASFDPSARQLVLEAAQLAGYPEPILLEEPQAAFYAWLEKHESEWRKILKVGDKILVVDIGGGTTDFSLISVASESGDLSLERLAVGSHLLLGGDNLDLALAYFAKNKLEEKGHAIDDWQLRSLMHTCRGAKELLLSEKPPKSADITVMGRGSRLIGGSLKTTISKEEALSLLVDGFVPKISPTERAQAERLLGFQEIGLPYAQDARISSQLAKFLSMTGQSDSDAMGSFVYPSHVLFNGGTMKSEALRRRILDILNEWAAQAGKPQVMELPGPDYDFAVSRGAVYYGIARSGKAIRIKGGISRSYFIGVEDARPAVPGIPPSIKAICVAPFGMEEGSEAELPGQEFALVLGQQAAFRFFSQATPHLNGSPQPAPGYVVKEWKDLAELHPIEANLEKREGDGKTVRVKLKAKVTELGVLEIWCTAADGREWKLEFALR